MASSSLRTAAPARGLFPPAFRWGAATSAYQIEGSADAQGKGASTWDLFCRRPETVRRRATGIVACDHYRRFADDVRLMGEIGLQAYRFSISWPRVLPEGAGAVNPPGLDFYDALVDALLAESIEPWVTLFHWDYPAALEQRGGWLSPESPQWFADYVGVVAERLADRVTRWITINEPQVFLDYGHRLGIHAPGERRSAVELLPAVHHVLLAHAQAVRVLRSAASRPLSIGWAPVGIVSAPRNPASPSDVEAALAAAAAVDGNTLWNNVWYNDPVFFGRYPDEGLAAYQVPLLPGVADELETIAEPIDFLGINVYSADIVDSASPAPLPCPPGAARNTLGWPIVDDALYWGVRFFHERYQTPIVITENGLAGNDWVALDGGVHDPQRIDYTKRSLQGLRRAVQEGIDVRGYFHWSLLDNFEWAEGYDPRFGLIHVDYATQQRTIKDSARWYREVIATSGAALDK